MRDALTALLADDNHRAYVEREINVFWRAMLGPQPERTPEAPSAGEDDEAFRQGCVRRDRVFGASKWSLRQALAVLIFFREFRELSEDHPLRPAVAALRKSNAAAEYLREDESARPWIDAVARSREDLATVGFRMHPLLWIRWACTFAPHSIDPTFWTEFGTWRRERGAYELTVRGVDAEGGALWAPDGEGFAHVLIPLDSFIHGPMAVADYGSDFKLVSVTDAYSMRKGLADFFTQERVRTVSRGTVDPHRERLERVKRRVGPGPVQLVGEAVQALRQKDKGGHGSDNQATWERSGYMWLVDCRREALISRVIEYLRSTGRKVPAPSVIRSSLSAFVDFPGSHRPIGQKRSGPGTRF
jgi:hypothetical protein